VNPLTRTAALAHYFNNHPNVWIDGRALAAVAGAYALEDARIGTSSSALLHAASEQDPAAAFHRARGRDQRVQACRRKESRDGKCFDGNCAESAVAVLDGRASECGGSRGR
jgi:hypothetical protein